jgi:hypothetical protein
VWRNSTAFLNNRSATNLSSGHGTALSALHDIDGQHLRSRDSAPAREMFDESALRLVEYVWRGGVPQLVRGPGSYPGRRRFEPDLRYQVRIAMLRELGIVRAGESAHSAVPAA